MDALEQDMASMRDEWIALMAMQVEFFTDREIRLLHQVSKWTAAKTVLEVGVGPGYFLKRVTEAFPDKHYTAIDRDLDCTVLARQLLHTSRFCGNILHSDFYSHSGSYDAVVLRMFLQHQQCKKKFAAQACRLAHPDGLIILIDPNESSRLLTPAIGQLDHFFEVFRTKQISTGVVATLDEDISASFEAHGWSISTQVRIDVAGHSKKEMAEFACLMKALVRLLPRVYNFQFPAAELIDILTKWETDGIAFTLGERVRLISRAP